MGLLTRHLADGFDHARSVDDGDPRCIGKPIQDIAITVGSDLSDFHDRAQRERRAGKVAATKAWKR